MAVPERVAVEVVYALRDRQHVSRVRHADGMTAIEAVEASGLLQTCPELAGSRLDLGVYGRVVRQTHVLWPADRVEIYRPLTTEPREARRRLAAGGKTRRSE